MISWRENDLAQSSLPKNIQLQGFNNSMGRSRIRIKVGSGTIEKGSIGQMILDEFLLLQEPFKSFTALEVTNFLINKKVGRVITKHSVSQYLHKYELFLGEKMISDRGGETNGLTKNYFLTARVCFFIANYQWEEKE